MSSIRSAKNTTGHYIKKHPWLFRILAGLLLILLALTLFFAVTNAITERQLPSKVWLPDATMHTSDDAVTYSLPIRAETVVTKFGHAVRYTSTASRSDESKNTKPWTTIYEFRTNERLNAAFCPNITGIEELLPSACSKLGENAGNTVYALNRRLPSGVTEYFTSIENTFIYIKVGGDGGRSLDYLNTFTAMSRDSAESYLATNSGQLASIQSRQRVEKAAADKNDAQAYTRLDFTPFLAGGPPSDWNLSKKSQLRLDGPDANHPKMLNATYSSKTQKDQYISWHVAKLSDFKIGDNCGPSPGYSMEYLPCQKVTGADYYEATSYGMRNDFVRFLYYPVGDSLIITRLVAYSNNDQRPNLPTGLIQAQDELTLSAQAVDKSELKNSTFYKLYH